MGTLILLALVISFPAFGYIDPGAGSYLVQLIAAAFAIGASTFRWWISFFRRPRKKQDEKPNPKNKAA